MVEVLTDTNGNVILLNGSAIEKSGGGGGSGYKVYFRCRGSDVGYCRINDNDDYDFRATYGYDRGNAMITPAEGVTKIKFYNFDHPSSYPSTSASWVRWRPHASDWQTWTGDSGQDLVIGGSTPTELTLTEDIDIFASYATCLTGDTLITMADGTTKRLDHVYVGDMVMGCNGPVKVTYCDSDCDKWHNVYEVWTFDDGTVIKTIHPHRFYNTDRKAFVYMAEWEMGEHALTLDGKETALISHETVEHDIRHYTIFTSDSNTYYANGLLSGNRNSVYTEGTE